LRPKAILRSYLIDRHHVTFDSGAGWQCVCAEFTATDDCRHIRESQGRHAAQTVIANRMSLPNAAVGASTRAASLATLLR
jgi:hypothetical protein